MQTRTPKGALRGGAFDLQSSGDMPDAPVPAFASHAHHAGPAELPFDGTIPVRHRFAGEAVIGAAQLGRRLALVWSRDRAFPGEMVSPRDVLATAAAMTGPGLMEVIGLVGSHLDSTHDLREQSMARWLTEIGRFALCLEASGVESLAQVTPADCEDFIDQAVVTRAGLWTAPSVSTRFVRRGAIRLMFGTARALQLASGDPTLDISLPPRPALSTRPLDDDEEALGRVWARPTLDGTRHAAAWALGQATATGTEQAAARVGDLDLGEGRVWLHGNESKREPRWGRLSEWGITQIERRLTDVGADPATPLITAANASRNSRQASVCSVVSEILVHAGLKTDRSVGPASLPAWAGATVFARTGRIDDAAHALGIRSLDRAAATIGWDW